MVDINTSSTAMLNYERATTVLYQIVSPFLIVFGTFGNVLTIAVLAKRKSNISPAVFMSFLAVADLLVLNTGLLRFWVKYTFDIDIRYVTEGFCCIQRFAIFFTTQFSSWMLVCVTIERLVSTWIPHRRALTCTTRVSVAVVCIIGMSLFCLNSHYLFGFGTKYEINGNTSKITKCVPLTNRYEHFIYHEWTIIDLCVFYLVPLVVLVFGNTAIVYKVIESRRRSLGSGDVQTNNSTNQATMRRNQTSRLTVTLVIVCAAYIVCVAPIVIYPIGEPYWTRNAPDTTKAMLTLIETVAVLVMYTNHTINFVLYFLNGSKFRQDVKRLLFGRCIQQDVQTVWTTGGLSNGESSRADI